MDDMLASLTKQTHVNILVDGQPLLQKADIKLSGSLHDALDSIADAFDYTWSVSKGGAVLMSKRFMSQDERPQVNLAEMLEMTRNMVRALTLVDYDKDETHWPLLVTQVADSFTQQQRKVLESGERIHASDLQPQQKAALQQAILSNTFIKALRVWDGAIPNLENMERSKLQARKRDSVAPGSPTHDYMYTYRGSDGQLHVIELQHSVYLNGNDKVVTP
jgi:hypothetical protein